MALFRRRSPAHSGDRDAEAISGFWTWWQVEGAAATAAAITARDPERMVPILSRQVELLGKGLAWELGPGSGAAHVLVVSAEGNPQLRGVARRWRRAAPAMDGIWEYADSRPAAADPASVVLTFGENSIDLASATAWARVAGAHLDVAVYHPKFADLAEPERQLATFVLLDTVLGEAATETWLGSIESMTHEPLDPVPLIGLRAVIRELNDRFTNADGEPAWALMEGITPDGDQVLVTAQIPLRSAVAPHLDTYVEVRVPFAEGQAGGMPDERSLQALNDFASHLSARLGESGRLMAHETHRGVRVMHFYVDGTTPAVEQLRPAITGWDQGQVTLSAVPDPSWEQVQRLRG